MQEIGILTGEDAKGDQFFAATYDGDDGQLMRLVAVDGSLAEDFSDVVPVTSVVMTVTGPVQFMSASEVQQVSLWFERAAMWLAMKEELEG